MNATPTHKSSDGHRRLRRTGEGRMLGGVAGGLARHFNLDVTLVRVILVALVFLGGSGIPLYAAGWLLIPEEGSDLAIADAVVRHAGGC